MTRDNDMIRVKRRHPGRANPASSAWWAALATALVVPACGSDATTGTAGSTSGGSTGGSSSETTGESTTREASVETGLFMTGESSSTTDTLPSTNSSDGSSTTSDALPVNLLVNPSFETWANASSPNTTPDGWTNCTVRGPAIGVDAAPDSCPGGGKAAVPAAASDGALYARGLWTEGVAQTVETTPGELYLLRFDHAASSGCWGGTPFSEWEVVVDGVPLTRTPDDVGEAWTSFEVTFVAEVSATTVCLRAGHGRMPMSFGAALDNVWLGRDVPGG